MATAKTAMRKTTKKKMADEGSAGGFTIIEVVLVLAIAGLIFLMVFVAWPALSRSQRDTQRRQQMAQVVTQVQNYANNNNGRLPDSDTTGFVAEENGAEKDLDGTWKCVSRRGNGNTAAKCFLRDYLNGGNATSNEFLDPDGYAYGIKIGTLAEFNNSVATSFDRIVYIVKGAHCDGDTPIASTNNRDYAVAFKLEGTGNFCQSTRQ